MSNHTKNTRPDAGTPERAAEKATLTEASIPIINFTTYRGNGQVRIAPLLIRGQGGAISCRELANISGLSRRAVRQIIERERRFGVPILSNCTEGYYLAGDQKEAAQFVQSMRHRADEILKTAAAIETTTQQIAITGWWHDAP